MALINCPECGHQMSDTAKKCPNCGYKQPNIFQYKGYMSLYIGLLISVISVGLLILAMPTMSGFSMSSEIYLTDDDFWYGILEVVGSCILFFFGCKFFKKYTTQTNKIVLIFIGIAIIGTAINMFCHGVKLKDDYFSYIENIEKNPNEQTVSEDSTEASELYKNGIEALNQQDYEQAMTLFIKASEMGNAEAMNDLGVMYSEGIGIAQDYSKAFEWYNKAAQSGLPVAQASLGICYQFGEGTDINLQKAVEWYKKSAEQGDKRGQYNLGNCYFFGYGVAKDYRTANKWYLKSAEQGYAMAQYCIGMSYYFGDGINQDYTEAAKWFSLSAEQGYDKAQYSLGLCYSKGRGVEQNTDMALKYYILAAKQGNEKAIQALE